MEGNEPECRASFWAADLLGPDELPADAVDTAVCFSVLEHIADADAAARGLARALEPDGTLVTGYPMVSAVMNKACKASGYPTIDEEHVSTPARIAAP